MRAVTACCAAGACRARPRGVRGRKTRLRAGDAGEETVSALSDSLEIAARRGSFRRRARASHAGDPGRGRTRERPTPCILEALALVSASEEMYLQGRLDIAVKLLDEAARSLKPKR